MTGRGSRTSGRRALGSFWPVIKSSDSSWQVMRASWCRWQLIRTLKRLMRGNANIDCVNFSISEVQSMIDISSATELGSMVHYNALWSNISWIQCIDIYLKRVRMTVIRYKCVVSTTLKVKFLMIFKCENVF